MTPAISCKTDLAKHPNLPDTDEFQFAWVESATGVRLDTLPNISTWNDINQWPSGRIFGHNGEYRWQAGQGGNIHGVYISDCGHLLENCSSCIEFNTYGSGPPEDTSFFLWGEWINPQSDLLDNPSGAPFFFAPEIPQKIVYPMDKTEAGYPSGHPLMIVRKYYHEEHGEFLRCVGFEMGKETACRKSK